MARRAAVTNAAGGIVWQFKGLTHIEEGTSERRCARDDRPEGDARPAHGQAGRRAGVSAGAAPLSTTNASSSGLTPEPRRRSATRTSGTRSWSGPTAARPGQSSCRRHSPHAGTHQRRREPTIFRLNRTASGVPYVWPTSSRTPPSTDALVSGSVQTIATARSAKAPASAMRRRS